jgi:hypothetical protein
LIVSEQERGFRVQDGWITRQGFEIWVDLKIPKFRRLGSRPTSQFLDLGKHKTAGVSEAPEA